MQILRSYKTNTPLTDENLRANVPAIFADHKYNKMSDRYTFIPTSQVLAGMRAAGFQPYEARQSGSRSEDREPYTRHMLRFRHVDAPTVLDGLVPEVVVINGHDGSAQYQVFGGLFRVVCLNGLMVGMQFANQTIRHIGNVASQVIEGSYKIVEEELPKIMDSVAAMKAATLDFADQHNFAKQALAIRYAGQHSISLKPEQLLELHREVDSGNDVWSIFNRVQENLLSTPHKVFSFTGRRSNVREVSAVKEQVRINRALWDAAARLAAA
jgi:hypothetical protein